MQIRTLLEAENNRPAALALQSLLLEQIDDVSVEIDGRDRTFYFDLSFDYVKRYHPKLTMQIVKPNGEDSEVRMILTRAPKLANNPDIPHKTLVQYSAKETFTIKEGGIHLAGWLDEVFIQDIWTLDIWETLRERASKFKSYESVTAADNRGFPIRDYAPSFPVAFKNKAVEVYRAGCTVYCKAVIKEGSQHDPIGYSNAINRFNDDYLRKPNTQLIKLSSDSWANYWLYYVKP